MMDNLEELDKQLMINCILDIQEDHKRTPAFYNTVGQLFDRHEFILKTLRERAGGFDHETEYTRDQLTGSSITELLGILDALIYLMILKDMQSSENRKPTFYSAINKFLSRHKVSLSNVKADVNVIPDSLKGALAAYEKIQEEELWSVTSPMQ